ncbi:MAG TPA: hypothetical protein VF221_06250 [Chloroflexota bacterium]
MRRLLVALLIVVTATGVFASRAHAGSGGNGNGAPSGPHFDLNIHGAPSSQGFNGNNQNDIFVPLNGSCTINLVQSLTYDFQVTQPDCVNNTTAEFTLPAPCMIDPTTGLCSGTTTTYSVYIRALGKPNGSLNLTPCATIATGSTITSTYCQTYGYVSVAGKRKFANVTGQLLFIQACEGTKAVSVPLFSPLLQNYTWTVDNTGLKLAQLRFYQIPSNVPTPTAPC